MLKLSTKDGLNFSIPKKREFKSRPITPGSINKALDFAYQMTYGEEGEHRNHRSGGSHQRKNGEIFCDAFQGKLAELYAFQRFKKHGISSSRPDLDAWKLGRWDDADLVINGKAINVKSMAFFSNLLLLETKDWDSSGLYIPNQSYYDYFVIVRIKPDIKSVFRSKKLHYSNNIDFEVLREAIFDEHFEADIPGYTDNKTLKKIIKRKQILPKGSRLNNTVTMDAENYYLISDDFGDIFDLRDRLLETQQ